MHMSMPTMIEVTPFSLHVKLNGFTPLVMINHTMWEVNKLLCFLMAMQLHYNVDLALCIGAFLGKPTYQDLDQYLHILLTRPHEWDPSVLDYSNPSCGYPSWAPEPSFRDQHAPIIDECCNIHHRTVRTLSILSDASTLLVNKHDKKLTVIDYNKLKSYFDWVNVDTIKKTFENTT